MPTPATPCPSAPDRTSAPASLPFDPAYQCFPSQRYPLFARRGMVNCSSPLAAAAGMEALQAGGNAVDAAAAALTVVDPTANGLGSDAFALVWSPREGRLVGLNASGPAPRGISIERVIKDGRAVAGGPNGAPSMPKRGWTPVTVPGAVGAWAALTERFGRRTLAENVAPAVRYAREGYPCAADLARAWAQAHRAFAPSHGDAVFDAWFRTFADFPTVGFPAADGPAGRAPRAGELVVLPDHAATLEAIGATNGRAFYEGDVARAIDASSRAHGGYLRYEDLAAFRPQWVEPVAVGYRGYTVCEIPPNGQGIAALMALNVLKEFDFSPDALGTPLACHRQIEAMKIAFADAFRYVTDPARMEIDYRDLLDPAYSARRAAEIGPRAADHGPALPPRSGTVYPCCADGEGTMVSYIQSNYMGFGSGVVVEGTGVALQNRGADFSLDPAAANRLEPGKRTYHTIIPGFLMRGGRPVGPFGVMGGYMQPQGHVQTVMNYVDLGLDPQQALDAPRWQWLRDGSVIVETRFAPEAARQLRQMGHDVRVELDTNEFGRGQMIVRLDNGVLVGGTESRTDSNIACW